MKRKIATLTIFVLLFSVTFMTGNLYAGHGMSKYSSIVAKKFKGEVMAIDLEKKTINIKQNETVYQFDFDENTLFQKDKNVITPADIKIGQKVTIRSLEMNNKNVAKNVTVSP